MGSHCERMATTAGEHVQNHPLWPTRLCLGFTWTTPPPEILGILPFVLTLMRFSVNMTMLLIFLFFLILLFLFCIPCKHQTFPAPFLSLSVSCSSFCLTIQFSAYPSLPAGTLALCWEKPRSKEIPELNMVFAALQTKIVTSAKQCTSLFTQPFKFSYSARAE